VDLGKGAFKRTRADEGRNDAAAIDDDVVLEKYKDLRIHRQIHGAIGRTSTLSEDRDRHGSIRHYCRPVPSMRAMRVSREDRSNCAKLSLKGTGWRSFVRMEIVGNLTGRRDRSVPIKSLTH